MIRTVVGNDLRALVWSDGALALLDNPRGIENRRDGGTYMLAALAAVPVGFLAWFAGTMWWQVWTVERGGDRMLLGATIATVIVLGLVVTGAAKLTMVRQRRRPIPGWRTVMQFDTDRGLARRAPDGAWFHIGQVAIEATIERRAQPERCITSRHTWLMVDVAIRFAGERHQLRAWGGVVPKPFAPFPLPPGIDAGLRELGALGFTVRVEQPWI